MASDSLHERFEDLTSGTIDLHRAIRSLMEELEAVDWYQQRVDATPDEELKAVLGHNRDEEIEHAMMTLEWIRRRNPTFDEACKTFLFSKGPITEVEEAMKEGGGGEEKPSGGPSTRSTGPDGSLGIGSLKIG